MVLREPLVPILPYNHPLADRKTFDPRDHIPRVLRVPSTAISEGQERGCVPFRDR
jgi:hypothetical protein